MNWWSGKLKNRRLERGHVLEVKLRSREAAQARWRLAGTALAVALGSVAGLFLLWRGTAWALDEFVYRNGAFAVRRLMVETNGSLGDDQILRWSGVRAGENLLALDLGRVKRDLELVPVIRSAEVHRVLPDTLRICVEERSPMAKVRVPQFRGPQGQVEFTTYWVDEKGYILQPLGDSHGVPGSPRWEALPGLFGLQARELRAGARLVQPQVTAALELIREFEGSPMAGLVDIKMVDVSTADSLVVLTAQGNQITFATGQIPAQLLRWRLVYDLGIRTRQAIRTADFSVTNNVPVVWQETAAAPAVNPSKPARPATTTPRRKHV